MLDTLYILGRGSKHDDMELRLSLRCLEKNAKGIGRVFIVGNCPDWVQNVVHIPAEDTWTPENNAFQKILKACRSDISDMFLLMNDDFFMLRPFDVETYPYYDRGYLEKKEEDTPYNRSINKTIEVLKMFGDRNTNYEVHCPIRIQKNKFLLMTDIAEYFKKENTGVLCRSLYGNIFDTSLEDFYGPVEDPKNYDDEWKPVQETGCLSTSDNCDNILKRIEEVCPLKSRCEK